MVRSESGCKKQRIFLPENRAVRCSTGFVPPKKRSKLKIKPSKGARRQPCAFAGFHSFPICGEHIAKNKAATMHFETSYIIKEIPSFVKPSPLFSLFCSCTPPFLVQLEREILSVLFHFTRRFANFSLSPKKSQLFLHTCTKSFIFEAAKTQKSAGFCPRFSLCFSVAALAAAGAAAAAVVARLVVFVQRPQGKAHTKANHADHDDIAKHRVSFLSPPGEMPIMFLTCGRTFRSRSGSPCAPPGTPIPPGPLPPEQ